MWWFRISKSPDRNRSPQHGPTQNSSDFGISSLKANRNKSAAVSARIPTCEKKTYIKPKNIDSRKSKKPPLIPNRYFLDRLLEQSKEEEKTIRVFKNDFVKSYNEESVQSDEKLQKIVYFTEDQTLGEKIYSFFNKKYTCFGCKEKFNILFMICINHQYCKDCANQLIEYRQMEISYCDICNETFSSIFKSLRNDGKSTEIWKGNNEKCDEMKNSLRNLEISKANSKTEKFCDEKHEFHPISSNFPLERNEIELIEDSVQIEEETSRNCRNISRNFESFVDINSIEITQCYLCKINNNAIGLLCNHNLCVDCISKYGLSEILAYEHEYPTKSGRRREKFNYHCPIEGCKSIVSYPTAMILKNILTLGLVHQFNITEDYITRYLSSKIPFYDGVDY